LRGIGGKHAVPASFCNSEVRAEQSISNEEGAATRHGAFGRFKAACYQAFTAANA
jgi:hypothetical protein